MPKCVIRDQHLWEQQLKQQSNCLLLEYIIQAYTFLTTWIHGGGVPHSADFSRRNNYFLQLLTQTQPHTVWVIKQHFCLNFGPQTPQPDIKFSKCLMGFGVKIRGGKGREEEGSLKHMKQTPPPPPPPEGFLEFSLIGIDKAPFLWAEGERASEWEDCWDWCPLNMHDGRCLVSMS